MNTTQKTKRREQGAESLSKEQRNQRARRLNAIRVQMACIARDAAEDVFQDPWPYACNSIRKVVDRQIGFLRQMEWRLLLLGVFGACFKPQNRGSYHDVWWKDGDQSVRALALLFLQRVIERASLDEVEMWVRTYAPGLLADEEAKAQAGKPMLRGEGGRAA